MLIFCTPQFAVKERDIADSVPAKPPRSSPITARLLCPRRAQAADKTLESRAPFHTQLSGAFNAERGAETPRDTPPAGTDTPAAERLPRQQRTPCAPARLGPPLARSGSSDPPALAAPSSPRSCPPGLAAEAAAPGAGSPSSGAGAPPAGGRCCPAARRSAHNGG